jgi:rhamnulokinase
MDRAGVPAAWEREGNPLTYPQLAKMAADAMPLRSFIDTAHVDFGRPGDMPEKIRAFCRRTGQHVPDGEGAVRGARSKVLH